MESVPASVPLLARNPNQVVEHHQGTHNSGLNHDWNASDLVFGVFGDFGGTDEGVIFGGEGEFSGDSLRHNKVVLVRSAPNTLTRHKEENDGENDDFLLHDAFGV